jgi:23S rRNA pseudouridine1911/1915/1917 synthase
VEEIMLNSDVNGVRIDSWLSSRMSQYSRTFIQKLISEGLVTVNDNKIKSNYRLKLNDKIVIIIPEPEKIEVKAEKIALDVIYEDSDIIVINKPKNMVVHPAVGNYSGTLVNALMEHCGESLSDISGVIRPGIVHRLDKDTTGVLVVAKNNTSHKKLSDALKERSVKRIYVALVYGVIHEESGKIDAAIGRHPVNRKKMAVVSRLGRRAVTYFKVLERFKDTTYVQLTLETGRTHQIRVHMSYIGHPVIGDTVYGGKQKYKADSQMLHAKILGFVHPASNEYMEFEADIPAGFKNLSEQLRRES